MADAQQPIWSLTGVVTLDAPEAQCVHQPGRASRRASISCLATIVSLILSTLVIINPAAASVAPVPVRTIPTPFISGHAELYGWGAATLSDGTVIIGDYWNLRVAHYAKDGTPLGTLFTLKGFANPYGLAVDPRNDNVYVADVNGKSVKRYVKNANTREYFLQSSVTDPGFKYPSRVAVAADGALYVADTWANKVFVFDDAGIRKFSFGSVGSADGQFRQPRGVVFDDQQRLFVVDAGNFRVQVFDTSGQLLYKFGSKGTAPSQFKGDLRGIGVDRVNHWVYVVDAGSNKVRKFDLDGNWLLNFGLSGPGDGAFTDGGRETTVDGDGNVWVGDMPNFRAQKFSPAGAFLTMVPSPPQPPPDGGFNGPRGVAVDKFGNIFVTDTYNWRIQKFSPEGAWLWSKGTRGRGPYKFNYARMIATDPNDGSFVVADTDNHAIKKYDNDGVFLWSKEGPGNVGGSAPGYFRNPHGVEIGPDGRIYVADTQNKRVQVLDPADGHVLYVFGSAGSTEGKFTYPRGIGVDAENGEIWVSDASNRDVIHHFTNSGQPLGHIGSPGSSDNQLSNPFDVEADGGYIYVADTQSAKIKVFQSDGTFSYAFGGMGAEMGSMDLPQGLDLIPGSRLYVAEQGNDRIQEWSLCGPTPCS